MAKKVYAFDVDECLEVSKGPIPIQTLLDLRQDGHIVGLCGNWGFFAAVVPDWHRYVSFLNVAVEKSEWLAHFKTYIRADEYIMVGNEMGVTGASDDKGAAERAGWRFIREDAFMKGER